MDVAIALENIVLAAWALGVGSCWIGTFDENAVKRILGIPKDLDAVALLSLGYPRRPIGTKSKKPFDEIVHFNKF